MADSSREKIDSDGRSIEYREGEGLSMIEFERHESILSDSELTVIDVRWGGGEFGIYDAEDNVTYAHKADDGFDECELYVDVFSHKFKSIYRIEFQYIYGYRLLDEGGLLDFWSSPNYDCAKLRPIARTRNSPWSKESIIPFIYSKGISYLIITENECVEVITDQEPTIHFVRKLEEKHEEMLRNRALVDERENPAELIGKKVYLQHDDYKEYGVIVNAWIDSDIRAIDCHVAFYPDGLGYGHNPEQVDKPYVLRYLYASLIVKEH